MRAFNTLPVLTRAALVLMPLVLSCSADRPPEAPPPHARTAGTEAVEATGAAPARGANAAGYSLSVTPEEATLSTTLELKPGGFKLEEAEVGWLLNGRDASTSRLYYFDIPELDVRKGDTVQARAVVGGREVLSNVVKVVNAAPELLSASLVPEVFGPGDSLALEAEAHDPDGDPVTVQYRWTVNGRPAGSGKTIGAELKRGDTFTVEATPFDGQERGQGISITRKILNLPPVLTQHYDFTFDGALYTYAVKAHDPDGDPLEFTLHSAPGGMSIDPVTGLVTWKVPGDFLGVASFVVAASDGQGGRTEMTLRFALSDDKTGESAK